MFSFYRVVEELDMIEEYGGMNSRRGIVMTAVRQPEEFGVNYAKATRDISRANTYRSLSRMQAPHQRGPGISNSM